MWVATGVMVATTAYSAKSSADAANDQADAQSEAAQRKYRLESGISSQQMEEQQTVAMEKMTDVSRDFIKAKSTAKVIAAESGVSGVSAERAKANMRVKASEAKGKVAKEVDTNVINIAQGMLASKINTENSIAEANSKRRSVVADTVLGAIQGGLQGYSMGGGSASKADVTSSTSSNAFDISQKWSGYGPRPTS